MYKLVLDKSNFFKIKYGQNATQIQKILKIPVVGEVFCGKIISVAKKNYFEYDVKVGETYFSIANKFKVEEKQLISVNGEKPLYPTCKIFVPK